MNCRKRRRPTVPVLRHSRSRMLHTVYVYGYVCTDVPICVYVLGIHIYSTQRGSNGIAPSPIELPAGATSQPSRRWISHHHHHRVCESVGQLRGVCVWEPKRHGYPDTTTTNHSHSDFVRSSPGGYRIVDSSPAERILATTGLSPWSPLLLVRDQANVPQNQVALY